MGLCPTVNARELHGFLKNGKMFAHWIKERIEKYGFVDGVDYCATILPKQAKTSGRPAKEYHVSVGMAKALAMVERYMTLRPHQRLVAEFKPMS